MSCLFNETQGRDVHERPALRKAAKSCRLFFQHENTRLTSTAHRKIERVVSCMPFVWQRFWVAAYCKSQLDQPAPATRFIKASIPGVEFVKIGFAFHKICRVLGNGGALDRQNLNRSDDDRFIDFVEIFRESNVNFVRLIANIANKTKHKRSNANDYCPSGNSLKYPYNTRRAVNIGYSAQKDTSSKNYSESNGSKIFHRHTLQVLEITSFNYTANSGVLPC